MSAVLYKDSNGVKYGVIQQDDNEKNRYLVTPFGSDSGSWISKDGAVLVDCEEVNEDFIKMSLESATEHPEKTEENRSTVESDNGINVRQDAECKLPTFSPVQAHNLDSKKELCSDEIHWKVGQVCVCRWHCDNEWYFATLTAVYPEDRTVDVRFLYYDNAQMLISFDQIYPVNPKTVDLVKDAVNIDAAHNKLGIFWPSDSTMATELKKNKIPEVSSTSESEKRESQEDESSQHFSTGYGPDGTLDVPELSRFWLSMVEKTFGSESSAIRKLILSQYQLGYDAGFKMGLQSRGVDLNK